MTGLDVSLLFIAAFSTACALMLGAALWQKRRVKTTIEELDANSGWTVLAHTHECSPPAQVDADKAGLGSVWACGVCGAHYKIERWYGSTRGHPTWKLVRKGHYEQR